jgi:ABC-type phosphate/phosphonate transport system substrate-binding protein
MKSSLTRNSRILVLKGVPAIVLGVLLVSVALEARQVKVLRIGTSGSLVEKPGQKEEGALETLKQFIKEETGLDNEILRQKDWRELADKMAKGELHLGAFQGYEYAWAQEEHPNLKPLALAINVYAYPVGYVVTHRNNQVKEFGELRGQALAVAGGGPRFLRLFLEHQAKAAGKDPETFFSKIVTKNNVEDALDDVVDGLVQATVVDRVALEVYKQRKPGRFKNIKEVVHSKPFPPPLIAYYGKVLDDASRERFRTGLLNANRKEKGETMLTLFRLTGFVAVPEDFDKVLAETRKTYPPPDATLKGDRE